MMLHRTQTFCQNLPTLAAHVPASRATACAELLSEAGLQAVCIVSACCVAGSNMHSHASRQLSVDGQCMRSCTWEKKCSGKPRPMAKHDINFIDMSWQAAMKAAAASAKPAQSASLGHLSAVWKPRDMDSFISGVPVEGRICSDQYLECSAVECPDIRASSSAISPVPFSPSQHFGACQNYIASW